MEEKETFQKLENGQFVPTDDPDSIAKTMSMQDTTLSYRVSDWVIIDNVSGYDQSIEERWFYRDEQSETRLRCILNNDRRILHSIKEEGTSLVGTKMNLDIVPIEKAEIDGQIRHWPAPESESEGESQNQLIATLGIPKSRFLWIIERLRNQDAVLNIRISMQLYKSAIASSFDESWMMQDYYFPYETITPILAYEIYVADGPGYKKIVDGEDTSESEGNILENLEEYESDPDTIPSKGLVDQKAIIDQLNVIKIALIVLVTVQLISLF